MKTILPIVEGDGDSAAVPELIRRVAYEANIYDVQVLRAHKRGDLPKVRKRFKDYLAAAVLEHAPILWVMDYDCPSCDSVDRDLAALKAQAAQAGHAVPVEFAFMVKEFESLFLADHETTKSYFSDVSPALNWPTDPEQIRDAKGWISKARPKGLAYKETVHQVKLTSQLDLNRLRVSSPSFVRFEAAVMRLLSAQVL